MSDTLTRVQKLVVERAVRTSNHAYDELMKDGILAVEVNNGVARAVVVEDYPNAAKGPTVLVLQEDFDGRPIHVLWGIPKGREAPAVLVTAYRPDPSRWSNDFMRRKTP